MGCIELMELEMICINDEMARLKGESEKTEIVIWKAEQFDEDTDIQDEESSKIPFITIPYWKRLRNIIVNHIKSIIGKN